MLNRNRLICMRVSFFVSGFNPNKKRTLRCSYDNHTAKKKRRGLEEIVELTGKRALEVRIKTVKRILLHVLDFIPRVKNRQVFVSPGKRKLDTETAVHSASSAFAAGRSDSTVLLVEADKVRVPLARSTPVSLPEEVLKPTFLKLHHLLQIPKEP